MRALLLLGALLAIGCTTTSNDEGTSGGGRGGAGGTGTTAGSGGTNTTAGSGGTTTTAGSGGNGPTAGAGGTATAGAGGTATAGAGGAATAGAGGTAMAGAGGTAMAGAAGSATAGTGGSNAGTGGAGAGDRVIGNPGIAAWDSLAASERAGVNTMRSFFLHQSVGTDLEDGAEANGFKFEYLASGGPAESAGLNGGLFNASNGDFAGKTSEWVATATANQQSLRLAIMKLGYADVLPATLEDMKTSYAAAVAAIKAKQIRVLHITPPLVYALPEDNAPKMLLRTWMIETFPNDVVFDLQDIESTSSATGARCEREGSWEICDDVRSTAGCPSKSQGVDAPTGQGHLCFEPQAKRIAKAFLYAIYRAEQ